MADGRQPEEHWASNGQENGENNYSTYSSAYRENGYHGAAAAHPATTGKYIFAGARISMCMQRSVSDIDRTAYTHTPPDGSTAVSVFICSMMPC